MNILAVIKVLNQLKSKHRLKDYAIFGAVGAAQYLEAVSTQDLDVIVVSDTDAEYLQLFREISEYGRPAEGFGTVISDTLVQIFPTSIGGIYASALKNARSITVDGLRTKVVDVEHLILLALESWRYKDKIRAAQLLPLSHSEYLGDLLRKFDDGTFRAKIKSIGGAGTNTP